MMSDNDFNQKFIGTRGHIILQTEMIDFCFLFYFF